MSWGNGITLKAENPADGDIGGAGAFITAPVAMDNRGGLRLTLNVTKAGGTPTLDVTIQTGETSTGPWRTLGTFAQATTVSSERKCFAGADRYVRASCAVGGSSPALRFTISGDAL